MVNVEDEFMARAERDASPERFPPGFGSEPTSPAPRQQPAALERIPTASSASTASTDDEVIRESIGGGVRQVATGTDLNRHPTELSRIATHRSQHASTIGRTSTQRRDERKPMLPMGAGKPYPPALPDREEYVVEFDGPSDPLHPQNWPMKKKIIMAAMLGYTTLLAAFGSSIFSTATSTVAAVFGVSTEVGILGLSLYVLGFAVGPMFWAPLSELQGRRLPIVIGMFGFTIFSFAVAVAKDLQTVLICRFFGGIFAACPLSVVAAVFSDIFDNRMRGTAIAIFSMAVFTGPLFAPFIGGFIIENHNLGWRWTQYLMGILGASAFVLDLFFLPETYAPVVLVQKASELRRRTLNWGIHAKQEEIEVDFRELVTKNFSRPLRILFTEPIVLLLSIYMAFIYGLLYLFLTAYPIVFQQIHHFSPGVGGLPYFGMVIGMVIAGIVIVLQQPSYNRKLAKNNNIPIPEWRLMPVVIGGVSFAGGLFWFGWSGYREDIPWIVPTLSGLLTGFGLLSIFLQSLNYIIDAYLMFAASAIAANTFIRSLAGAGFPLFSQYMFRALGVNWAGTLLGCVAVLLVPIPICFIIYGAKIREKSHFAPTFHPAQSAHVPRDEESASSAGSVDQEKSKET